MAEEGLAPANVVLSLHLEGQRDFVITNISDGTSIVRYQVRPMWLRHNRISNSNAADYAWLRPRTSVFGLSKAPVLTPVS